VATIASVPTARVEVIQTAVSDEPSGTEVQPEIAVPFEVKLTSPVGIGGPAGPTVAVRVASSPTIEGLGELVTEVVGPALTLSPDWKIVPLDSRVPEGRCYFARVVGATVPDNEKFEVPVGLFQN